jgi:hypothetical protein
MQRGYRHFPHSGKVSNDSRYASGVPVPESHQEERQAREDREAQESLERSQKRQQEYQERQQAEARQREERRAREAPLLAGAHHVVHAWNAAMKKAGIPYRSGALTKDPLLPLVSMSSDRTCAVIEVSPPRGYDRVITEIMQGIERQQRITSWNYQPPMGQWHPRLIIFVPLSEPPKHPGVEDIIAECLDRKRTPRGWETFDHDLRAHGFEARDPDGWNIAHHAARENKVSWLNTYLEYGGDIAASTIPNSATIGHLAAVNGHDGILRVYAERGGPMHGRDEENSTIGDYAASAMSETCMSIFLECGGDLWSNHATVYVTKTMKKIDPIYGHIANCFHGKGLCVEEHHLARAFRKMLPNMVPNEDKLRYPENFEFLMRKAFRVAPDEFSVFLAQCSTRAADGDDRLLQILCRAMEPA